MELKNKKARLIKESDNINDLRTNLVDGYLQAEPEVGKIFVFLGEPLDTSYDVRCIMSSPIASLEWLDDGVRINTVNTVYRIELLD